MKLDGATPKTGRVVSVHFEVSSSGLNVQVSGTTAECKKCRGKPGDDRSFNGGVIQLRPLPLKPYGELLGED